MSTYRSVAILAQAGFKNNTFLKLFGVVLLVIWGPPILWSCCFSVPAGVHILLPNTPTTCLTK